MLNDREHRYWQHTNDDKNTWWIFNASQKCRFCVTSSSIATANEGVYAISSKIKVKRMHADMNIGNVVELLSSWNHFANEIIIRVFGGAHRCAEKRFTLAKNMHKNLNELTKQNLQSQVSSSILTRSVNCTRFCCVPHLLFHSRRVVRFAIFFSVGPGVRVCYYANYINLSILLKWSMLLPK